MITTNGTRGILLPDGMVLYVDDAGHTLSAYSGSTLKWRTDVRPSLHFLNVDGDTIRSLIAPTIRQLNVVGDGTIQIIYAKHCWGTVQLENGTLEPQGCD